MDDGTGVGDDDGDGLAASTAVTRSRPLSSGSNKLGESDGEGVRESVSPVSVGTGLLVSVSSVAVSELVSVSSGVREGSGVWVSSKVGVGDGVSVSVGSGGSVKR